MIILSIKNKIAKFYNKLFNKYSDLISLPNVSNDHKSSWHLYIVNINFNKLKINKEKLIQNFTIKVSSPRCTTYRLSSTNFPILREKFS